MLVEQFYFVTKTHNSAKISFTHAKAVGMFHLRDSLTLHFS